MRGPRAAKIVGPGMVSVSIQLVFPDGSQGWRKGVIDVEHCDRLAFKYSRALREAWEFQLVDREPDPDIATLDEQLKKEINSTGHNRMNWGR